MLRFLPVGNSRCQCVDEVRYIPPVEAWDQLICSWSPDDTDAPLRLLDVLEACRQKDAVEAESRRRITGWARFNA